MFSPIPKKEEIISKCAVPFDANIHSVGDHNHYSLFYLCLTFNPKNLGINKKEVNKIKKFLYFTPH